MVGSGVVHHVPRSRITMRRKAPASVSRSVSSPRRFCWSRVAGSCALGSLLRSSLSLFCASRNSCGCSLWAIVSAVIVPPNPDPMMTRSASNGAFGMNHPLDFTIQRSWTSAISEGQLRIPLTRLAISGRESRYTLLHLNDRALWQGLVKRSQIPDVVRRHDRSRARSIPDMEQALEPHLVSVGGYVPPKQTAEQIPGRRYDVTHYRLTTGELAEQLLPCGSA